MQLGPNVVRCLQAWGLQKALQQVAAFPDRLQVRCALSGAELGVLPLGRTAVQRYGAAYATIHRADLHGLLHTGVQRYTDAQLYQGLAIEYFTDASRAAPVIPGGETVVSVRTSQGKEIEGDALIGADGLWSRTRTQLLGYQAPRVTGHLAYRALVRQSALPKALRTQHVTAWLGPRLHMVQYPVRRGELQNLVVIVQGPAPQNLETWTTTPTRATWNSRCRAPARALATRGAWREKLPVRLAPVAAVRPPARAQPEEMVQGLVALLGDAAHPMRPYLAQGAGMAIEDAAQLERALSMHDLEVPLRLRRYAVNRWQRNARVQARSTRNGRIFHATGPVRWARNLSLKMLGERLLDVPWLYRGDGIDSVRS